MKRKFNREKLAYGTIMSFPYVEGKRTDSHPLLFVTAVTETTISGADLLKLPKKELFIAVCDEIIEARSLKDLGDIFARMRRNRKMNSTIKTFLLENIPDMGLVTRDDLKELKDMVK